MKRFIAVLTSTLALGTATVLPASAAVKPNITLCDVNETCQYNVSNAQPGSSGVSKHTPNLTPENAESIFDGPGDYTRIHWTTNDSREWAAWDGIEQVGSWDGTQHPYERVYVNCVNLHGTNKVNVTFGSGGANGVVKRKYVNYVETCDGTTKQISAAVWKPGGSVPSEYCTPPAITCFNYQDNHPFVRLQPQKGGVDVQVQVSIFDEGPQG